MKKIFIKDIKEKDRVETTFLVTRKDIGISKTGKPYLSLKLMDNSGEFDARIWEGVETMAEGFDKDDVVFVKGNAVPYQGKIQLNIIGIKRVSGGEFSATDYLPSSKKNPKEMMAELDGVIADIKDRHLSALLKSVFADNKIRELFMLAPAAKTMHHPYLGGLLEHVISLCALAGLVSRHYEGINKDLLTTGVIFHDIGKIYELSYSFAFDYTDEGRLIGHITMGIELIEKKMDGIKDFPPALAMLLKHMILAHHGHLEFGSPKRPKTLEATVLYYLDDLDAKVNAIQTLMEKKGKGNWTDYQKLFDRYIYKGRYVESNEEEENQDAAAEDKPSENKKEFKLFE